MVTAFERDRHRACKDKVRYQSRELAEVRAQYFRDLRPATAKNMHPYWCTVHACWHIGHMRFPQSRYRDPRGGTSHAIELMAARRSDLIASYGKTSNQNDWLGVRRLTNAIRHMQRSLER